MQRGQPSRDPWNPLSEERGGGDYLVSVSDLMAGLLFIFILTVAVFALDLREQSQNLEKQQEVIRHQEERSRVQLVKNQELQRELEKLESVRKEAVQKQLDENRAHLHRQKALENELERLERKKQGEVDRLKSADLARRLLLQEIQLALKEAGLSVSIDFDHGVLRLPEEILFDSGSDTLNEAGFASLDILGAELIKILPCFVSRITPGESPMSCDRDPGKATLDAVILEGHTDDIPKTPTERIRDNWDLSAARAIHAFKRLLESRSDLSRLLNKEGVPLFGVAGYAESRPVASAQADAARRKNRRIDVRFLMSTSLEGIGPGSEPAK